MLLLAPLCPSIFFSFRRPCWLSLSAWIWFSLTNFCLGLLCYVNEHDFACTLHTSFKSIQQLLFVDGADTFCDFVNLQWKCLNKSCSSSQINMYVLGLFVQLCQNISICHLNSQMAKKITKQNHYFFPKMI